MSARARAMPSRSARGWTIPTHSSSRTARNEWCLEKYLSGIVVRIADTCEKRLEGGRGDFPDGLGDRSQRRLGRPCEGDVVETDDGYILWNSFANPAQRFEKRCSAFVVSADDGVGAGFPAQRGCQGACVGRCEIERTHAVLRAEQGEFAGEAEEPVVPVGVTDVFPTLAQKGDLPVAVIVEMVGDAASGVDVVDGDEVAVAAFRGTGDVRVDQHDRDLRPLADVDDFSVCRSERFVDVRTEDDAFCTGDDKFPDLAPDVPYGGLMVPFSREDELDLVVESLAMPFEFVLDVREELK